MKVDFELKSRARDLTKHVCWVRIGTLGLPYIRTIQLVEDIVASNHHLTNEDNGFNNYIRVRKAPRGRKKIACYRPDRRKDS